MIWGAPGIGKSSIVAQVAIEQQLDLIDLRLSQLAPTDLRGLPGVEDGQMVWHPPDFLPRGGRGVLFLDEINMAPPALQGVSQQLILDRAVGSYTLPDGWFVWAAGNRKEDRAAVFDMPAPLANRLVHLDAEVHAEDFRAYGLRQGLDPLILGFLGFRPNLLHKFDSKRPAWPSPRTWEMASELYAAGLDIAPAVGEGAAAEFEAYRATVEDVPPIDDILAGKDAEFPTEPAIRYATVTALAARGTQPDEAVNALVWLVDNAPAEWVQLYATDAFAMLRASKRMGPFQKRVAKNAKIQEFLADFVAISRGAA
jgi:hypothetical protein